MERTISHNWFWPECLLIRAAQFSRSGWSKRGNLESCGGKNVHARLGPFRLKGPDFSASRTKQRESDLSSEIIN